MVGGLAVADSGYVDLVASTKIPYVGTLRGPGRARAPNVFPRIAEKVAHTGPFVYYRQHVPGREERGLPLRRRGRRPRPTRPPSREPIKRVGFNIVHDSGLQLGEPRTSPPT